MVVLVSYTSSEKLPIYAYVLSVFIMTFSSYFLWFYHKTRLENSKVINSETELTTKALFKVHSIVVGTINDADNGKVDLFMLANMTSSDQVGIYNIALKLSMLHIWDLWR